MKKNIICSLLFVFLISCTSNTILKKPDALIPKDSMVLLLTDLLIAKSARDVKNLNFQRELNYTSIVYENYKIDSTRFLSSNYYYTSVINEYQEIIDKVKTRLEVIKDTLEKSKKIKDSIRKDSLDMILPKRKS